MAVEFEAKLSPRSDPKQNPKPKHEGNQCKNPREVNRAIPNEEELNGIKPKCFRIKKRCAARNVTVPANSGIYPCRI